MKKYILTLMFLLVSTTIFAQWNLTGSNLYPVNFSTVNVGIGTDAPAEKLHINGSVRGNQAGGALRINTQFGWLDLGPMNATWSHFQTNLPKFYFNKPVHIDGALSSYSALDLDLQTNGTQRLRILNSNGYVGIGTTTPQGSLHVGQIRPIILKSNGGNGVYGSEIGFNAVLDTYVLPNQFKKLGATNQPGGAAIVVNSTGSMYFQMYNATTNDESIIDYQPQIAFLSSGLVGIGTTNPTAKLHVSGGNIQVSSGHLILDHSGPTIYTGTGGGDLNRYLQLINSTTLTSASGLKAGGVLVADSYSYANPGENDLIVKGNVGIGTNSPDAKLTVKGSIHTQEVKVDLLGSVAPDYVFAPDYNLLPLSEVESYIKANQHLPEVPSAKQMEEEGLNLKEMNLLLLKKVEELTLHLIELKKENESLKTRVSIIERK